MKIQAQQLATQARAAQKAGDYSKAASLLARALDVEPADSKLRRERAVMLFATGDWRGAAHGFHDLHIDHPEDRTLWRDCAVVYMQLGEFAVAEQFLKKLVATDPSDFDSWINLCFIAGSTAQHSDALFYAMQALQLKPMNPGAHNNLGSVLLAVGRYDDALISFDTALKLRPDDLDAMSNVATTMSLKGQPAEALEIYQACLKKAAPDSEFAKTLKYRMSFDLFRVGRTGDGWEHYDFGFVPKDSRSRNPKRSFTVPQWDGRELKDETLLVWREQGLGDELMFLSVLNEARSRCKKIIVECDPRLIEPLSRSFPDIQVRSEALRLPDLRSAHDDFDVHVPMGSMMRFFRASLSDFERARPYVVPDPERRADFADRISALPNRIKVGICWRSGKLNPERNSSYVPISDLEPLFRLKDVDFINLQYGDCEEELRNVAEHFGVTIHHWQDIDLKNDLDGIFTLMSCLDHVVTAKTAVSEMAPAVGTPTSIFMPPNAWTLFGQENYVFYPNVEAFMPAAGERLDRVIPRIVDHLADRYSLAQ